MIVDGTHVGYHMPVLSYTVLTNKIGTSEQLSTSTQYYIGLYSGITSSWTYHVKHRGLEAGTHLILFSDNGEILI